MRLIMCLRARLHEMAEGLPTIPPNRPLMLGDGRAAPAWTPDPQSGTNEGYSLDNQHEKHSVSLRSAIRSSTYCQGEILGNGASPERLLSAMSCLPSKNGALRRSRRCDRVILNGLRYLRVQLDWLLFLRDLQPVAKGDTKKNTTLLASSERGRAGFPWTGRQQNTDRYPRRAGVSGQHGEDNSNIDVPFG